MDWVLIIIYVILLVALLLGFPISSFQIMTSDMRLRAFGQSIGLALIALFFVLVAMIIGASTGLDGGQGPSWLGALLPAFIGAWLGLIPGVAMLFWFRGALRRRRR